MLLEVVQTSEVPTFIQNREVLMANKGLEACVGTFVAVVSGTNLQLVVAKIDEIYATGGGWRLQGEVQECVLLEHINSPSSFTATLVK